jgi:hypothetical protein
VATSHASRAVTDVEPSTTAAAEVASIDSATFNELVAQARLHTVQQVRVFAERYDAGPSPVTNYAVSSSYGVADEQDRVAYRFDVEAMLLGEDEQSQVGRVEGSFVVIYDIAGARSAAPAMLELFGATSVPLVVHPFLREAVANTAARLGFPGVFMPTSVYGPRQDGETPAAQP